MKVNQSYKEKCGHRKIKKYYFEEINKKQRNEEILINEFANPNSFSFGKDGKIHQKQLKKSSLPSSPPPIPSTRTNSLIPITPIPRVPTPVNPYISTHFNISNSSSSPSPSSSFIHERENESNNNNTEFDDPYEILLDSRKNGITWMYLPFQKNNNNNQMNQKNKKSIEKINSNKSSYDISDYYSLDPSKKGLLELSKYLSERKLSAKQNSHFSQYFDPNDLSYENLLRLDNRPPTSQDISEFGLSLSKIEKISSILITSSASSSTSSSFSSRLICSVCQDDLRPLECAICLPHCRHIFHGECIGPWFLTHSDCPNCRQKIV